MTSKKAKIWLWLIVILAIIGALWWFTRTSNYLGEGSRSDDLKTQSLEAQSSSDEVTDIEKDVSATELNSLDKEFADIDAEFNF